MRRLEFAPAAETDLLDIVSYIVADNPERAQSFAGEIEAHCVRLLDFPESGRARPELAADLRSSPHGRYVIFYTPGAEVLRIERVLHGARDVETAFESRD